jgi:hypothetical protein
MSQRVARQQRPGSTTPSVYPSADAPCTPAAAQDAHRARPAGRGGAHIGARGADRRLRAQALLEAAARSGFQAQRSPRTVHAPPPQHAFPPRAGLGLGAEAAHALGGGGGGGLALDAARGSGGGGGGRAPPLLPRAQSGAPGAAPRPAPLPMPAAASAPVHVRAPPDAAWPASSPLPLLCKLA